MGMRGDPTASDWKRYWEAAAKEPVLIADTIVARRKEARHLLGPLLDDLSDGGPSTNRRGYVKET